MSEYINVFPKEIVSQFSPNGRFVLEYEEVSFPADSDIVD